MTEISPQVPSHQAWGFPSIVSVGPPSRPSKNTARRDGSNVWRALVLKINSQTDCRRSNLRDRAQSPPQAADNAAVEQALADWETLYSEYKDAGGQRTIGYKS